MNQQIDSIFNKNKKVLACVDGSTLSEAVCDYAVWIAQRVDAPLKLLNTIDHHHEMSSTSDLSGNLGVDSRDHLLEDIANQEQQESKGRIQLGKAILQAAKERIIKDGIFEPELCLQHGSLVDSLTELEDKIRVLVIGARGKAHEEQSHQIGSKLEFMIRSLHLPILVAYDTFKTPEKIMIAYDGSDAAKKAVDIVVNSPLYKNLCCHLVHVDKKGNSENILEQAVSKLRTAENIEIITSMLKGEPEQVLCNYQISQNIDMTIMGSFSHSRIHDLILGSFTVKMLTNTNTPLLLLR